MKPRYSVLQYIIGDYEVVHEIEQKDPEAEYLLITDNDQLKSDTWKIIVDHDLNGLSVFDKCYSIRFNIFKYASADICVYTDANITIKSSLKDIIDVFDNGKYDMALMPHPHRHNFIEEYMKWIQLRGYSADTVYRAIMLMNNAQYDFSYKGMFQGNFKIVRRGKLNSDFENLTFSMMKYTGSDEKIDRLDQVLYSFVLNMYFHDIKILPVSSTILQSSYIQGYAHGKLMIPYQHHIDVTKPDMKWMFNKQVECKMFL